uniref:Uncharacterized protein n=1 Tax=Ixodes ricinus TaxID=34613 RepID=A0A6B0UPR9_IXORI
MFPEDVLVGLLGLVEEAQGLVQPRQVVCRRHRDGPVVVLVVARLCAAALQRRLVIPARLLQVPHAEVQRSNVAEDLRRDVRLHLVLEEAGGRAVGRQRRLHIRLLQDLGQLDPGLHVLRKLLRHLF